MRIYAIRTVRVGKYPPTVRCPFQVGAFMAEAEGAYAGPTLQTVTDVSRITLYPTREMAQAAIDRRTHGFAATFEAVSFVLEAHGHE